MLFGVDNIPEAICILIGPIHPESNLLAERAIDIYKWFNGVPATNIGTERATEIKPGFFGYHINNGSRCRSAKLHGVAALQYLHTFQTLHFREDAAVYPCTILKHIVTAEQEPAAAKAVLCATPCRGYVETIHVLYHFTELACLLLLYDLMRYNGDRLRRLHDR